MNGLEGEPKSLNYHIFYLIHHTTFEMIHINIYHVRFYLSSTISSPVKSFFTFNLIDWWTDCLVSFKKYYVMFKKLYPNLFIFVDGSRKDKSET